MCKEKPVDTVWGYFGYDFEKNELLPSARSSIDWHIKKVNEEKVMMYEQEIGLEVL